MTPTREQVFRFLLEESHRDADLSRACSIEGMKPASQTIGHRAAMLRAAADIVDPVRGMEGRNR